MEKTKSSTPDPTLLKRPKIHRFKYPRCDKIQSVTLEVRSMGIKCEKCSIELVVKA